MANSEVQIANLVYRYAESIDSGDFEGAAALFEHATVMTVEGEAGPQELLAMWRRGIILHDNGSPRTKHIITNPIIEADEIAGRGTCRSYYTVLQQAGNGPLQPVICGRYNDAFECVDGRWRFSRRDYSLHDLIGDMSRHSASFDKTAYG